MVIVQIAVLFFVTVIALAQLFAPPTYHWMRNTVSDLGAQQYQRAWLMRLGFMGFGLLLSGGILGSFMQAGTKNYSDLLILGYALSVVLSGVFSTAPFTTTAAFSIRADHWHSVFAQTAGITFSTGILCYGLVYADANQRGINFVFFALVMTCSALVGFAKNNRLPLGLGLVQRGLYGVSLIWLLWRYQ